VAELAGDRAVQAFVGIDGGDFLGSGGSRPGMGGPFVRNNDPWIVAQNDRSLAIMIEGWL
jgi:hypothetical protein